MIILSRWKYIRTRDKWWSSAVCVDSTITSWSGRELPYSTFEWTRKVAMVGLHAVEDQWYCKNVWFGSDLVQIGYLRFFVKTDGDNAKKMLFKNNCERSEEESFIKQKWCDRKTWFWERPIWRANKRDEILWTRWF